MADKEKKKKKKEKVSLSLPNAWQTMKKRNETAQAKANFEGFWKAVGIFFIVCLILFVLFGGISQTGLIKTIFNWANNVQEKSQDWVSRIGVETNEDGIYLKINSDEEIAKAKENQADLVDISESSLFNDDTKDSKEETNVNDKQDGTDELIEDTSSTSGEVTPSVSPTPTTEENKESSENKTEKVKTEKTNKKKNGGS